MLQFPDGKEATEYRRELDMRSGIARTSFQSGGTRFEREVFISAPDDVLVLHLAGDDSDTIDTHITLTRRRDASVRAVADDALLMEGQIVDVPPPKGPEPNPGGSGPGGKHMRFATRLVVRTDGGTCRAADGERVVCLGGGARDVLLPMTIATLTARPLVDTVLFFSDLSGEVREWHLPALSPTVPDNVGRTFAAISDNDGWTDLSTITAQVDAGELPLPTHSRLSPFVP